METQTREEKGRLIFERGGVVRVGDHFEVESDAGKSAYVVRLTSCGEDCACGDCQYRHEVCKHIHAAKLQDKAELLALFN